MKRKHLGNIILAGTVVLAGLLFVQVYWFKRAFSVEEKLFDHSVQVALKSVGNSVSGTATVEKVSANFFFVVTEAALDDRDLDNQLRKEFSIRNLNLDYELGVYKADDDTLVYGNYVRATRKPGPTLADGRSELTSGVENFAVYFPHKAGFVAAQLDIWIFSTFVLLLMMGFFAYAIYSLLQERKFASLKSDFINNMTHEFKTPVANIRIAAEVLKQKLLLQEDAQVYLDILIRENEKLHLKIDQVLHGSSAESRRPRLELVDAHQLILECADAFQMKVRERAGTFDLNFQARRSTFLVDRELMAQAIANIIDNAEKYSVGRPRISVETRDTGNGLAITVTDQGIGIAANMRKKVFEKFFRIHAGNLANVKGFGLGLSFVRDVVRSHRGRINLMSEIDKGTQVKIIIPGA